MRKSVKRASYWTQILLKEGINPLFAIFTPTILLIHGAFAVGSVWKKVKPIFETAGYEATAPTLFPELRTFADPKPELASLGLSDFVEFFRNIALEMTKKYGEKPVIIGHSMGGLIAQKLAEENLGSAAIFITPAAPLG
ncbi:MAG: hypothetical protein FD128_2445 [Hyphomonadaceae bacterium]|nr:MAG: hypothetical protein FD128_2445 [Hyphomonadaceae bacterium]